MDDIPGNIHLPHFRVRRVVPDDLALICNHRERMFLEADGNAEQLKVMTENFRPWLQTRLRDGRYYGFVLMDNETPAAAVGLMTIEWPPHPAHPTDASRGYVLNVYVEQPYRRQGLASSLMKLAEAEFARRGVRFAVLHGTQAGKPVYEKLGWGATSEMAKRLQS